MGSPEDTDLQRQLDELARRVAEKCEQIAELQAEELASQKHAEQLEEALETSLKVGAAVGILMASRRVSQQEAFAILCCESQSANRKLGDIAEDLVRSYEARAD